MRVERSCKSSNRDSIICFYEGFRTQLRSFVPNKLPVHMCSFPYHSRTSGESLYGFYGGLIPTAFSHDKTQLFQENRHFYFQALIVLKPLVSLIAHLVACSARIAGDTQTHTQTKYCNPRWHACRGLTIGPVQESNIAFKMFCLPAFIP